MYFLRYKCKTYPVPRERKTANIFHDDIWGENTHEVCYLNFVNGMQLKLI